MASLKSSSPRATPASTAIRRAASSAGSNRMAIFTQPWTEHRIDENLLDPHSLQLADLCGNGRLDLVVGEIGKRETLEQEPPRLMLYKNRGSGRFERHTSTGRRHAPRPPGRLSRHGPPRHRLAPAARAGNGRIFVWFNGGG